MSNCYFVYQKLIYYISTVTEDKIEKIENKVTILGFQDNSMEERIGFSITGYLHVK